MLLRLASYVRYDSIDLVVCRSLSVVNRRRWGFNNLILSLLHDLIVHCHICVDFVQEVGVKLKLEIIFLLLLLLYRLIARTLSIYQLRLGCLSCCVNNVTLSKLLFILIAIDLTVIAWIAVYSDFIQLLGRDKYLLIWLSDSFLVCLVI